MDVDTMQITRLLTEHPAKMTSLPESIKQRISTVGKDDEFLGTISYHDQVLIVTLNDSERVMATSYFPTWEDIFADDWVSF